jgi:hypothetical protein
MNRIEPEIILGLDEFRSCIREAASQGKWDAWKRIYFEPFKAAFQPMLDVLYQTELNHLRLYVDSLDFNEALANAERFVHVGGVERVRAVLKQCAVVLPPVRSFPVYLIIGLGHANGMALPGQEPYIFIGLERAKCLGELDGLVAHEYNHLIRVQRFYAYRTDWTIERMSVGEFTLSEGLATIFALIHTDQALSPERISAVIPSLGTVEDILGSEREMAADIAAHWEQPAIRGMIERFIESGAAYYIGARAVTYLMDEGYDITSLTLMDPGALDALARPRVEKMASPCEHGVRGERR